MPSFVSISFFFSVSFVAKEKSCLGDLNSTNIDTNTYKISFKYLMKNSQQQIENINI